MASITTLRPTQGLDVAGREAGPTLVVEPSAHPLLTADDVAGILGVPRSFVYALSRRGELPTVRIGDRYVRFRTEALEHWIESCETTSPRRSR